MEGLLACFHLLAAAGADCWTYLCLVVVFLFYFDLIALMDVVEMAPGLKYCSTTVAIAVRIFTTFSYLVASSAGHSCQNFDFDPDCREGSFTLAHQQVSFCSRLAELLVSGPSNSGFNWKALLPSGSKSAVDSHDPRLATACADSAAGPSVELRPHGSLDCSYFAELTYSDS